MRLHSLLSAMVLLCAVACAPAKFRAVTSTGAESTVDSGDATRDGNVEPVVDDAVIPEDKGDPVDDPKDPPKDPPKDKDPNTDPCKDATKVVSASKEINFPETKDSCVFGQGDNLPAKAGFWQGKVVQTQSLDIPADQKLCEIAISSLTPKIQYSDAIVFNMDSHIMSTSEKWITQNNILTADAGGFIWDFAKVRGKQGGNFTNMFERYCYGAMAACDMPPKNQLNTFNVVIPASDLNAQMLPKLQGKAKINFDFITGCDGSVAAFNQPAKPQCFHTAVKFKIDYKTAQITP